MTRPARVSAVRNFHLPLPDELYHALRDEAAALRQPATVLARQAIETWLQQRRRAALHEAIAGYAAEHAGSPADLDIALEGAAIDLLRRGRKRKR